MKFECNTKPLSTALALGVISANVSNYHKKSTLIQLTATRDTLRMNIEAAQIRTEMTIKGSGDSDTEATILISSMSLKQLINTFEDSITTFEFTDNNVILHSGKSKFTLPKLVDSSELELLRPDLPEVGAEEISIIAEDWKYIKDHQMYAIAMSFIHPVYTRVWIGEGGDVLVGDYDNSLFTHSVHSELGTTCLLSDTIINLFNGLPSGSKLVKSGKDYLVKFTEDSLDYTTQFSPVYESDEGIGSYNSEIFLNMMNHPEGGIKVPATKVSKFLSQAELLGSATDDTIQFALEGGVVSLSDANVDCRIEVEGDSVSSYKVEFKTAHLKSVISNYGDDEIFIAPVMQEDEVSGILVWNDELTTILAGVE